MLKKHKMLSWLLAFCLCFAMAMPTFATETDAYGKVMPNDVLEIINGTQAEIFSAENDNTDLNKVFMETSFDITIPKIDLGNVHVTAPLTDSAVDEMAKQELREHGYTDAEIADMDLGDYLNISNTWKLSETSINIAKELYPELIDVDISNWTYGQYTDFKYEKACQINMPSQSEIAVFLERGITLEDANWLLKEYGTYENILAQSDETLKADLEEYYKFLIDTVSSYAEAAIDTADNGGVMDKDIYIEVVGFTGYTEYKDDVHRAAGTHLPQYRDTQEYMAAKVVKALYGFDSVPSSNYLTNIYGAWSKSQRGAHEGLDLISPTGGSTPTIYNVVTGVVRDPDSNHSTHHLAIYDSGTNKTYSYLHMNNIDVKVGTTLSQLGISVGKQGNKGNTSSQSGGKGYHVHFEVHSGNTSTLAKEWHDDELGSISPYQMWNLD